MRVLGSRIFLFVIFAILGGWSAWLLAVRQRFFGFFIGGAG
jgi:hypothetical protein